MRTVIIPAQIRAGRALLEWSQEKLATTAEVSLSTVRDAESERRAADTAAFESIRRALWNGGVVFMPGSQRQGPGVRLVADWPNIIRRPTTMQRWEGLPFTVEWQGRVVTVVVASEVLDDLDSHQGTIPDEIYIQTFERHRGKILDAVTLAIVDPTNYDSSGRLYIRQKDIDAVDAGPWHQVVIDSDEGIRDSAAAALMNLFMRKFIDAGIPRNVKAFHRVLPSGGHVYYFSPRAADFAQDVFDEFGGAACSEPADLDTLKKVKF